jgi:hypothetical protein
MVMFINGVAWLLRMFECPDLGSPGIDCSQQPATGGVGTQMSFVTTVGQNSSCIAGGVLVTNQVSPRLQIVSAEIVPQGSVPNDYGVIITSNTAVAYFPEMMPYVPYQFITEVIPRVGGWVTNSYTVTRGLASGTPCTQAVYIDGPACNSVGLRASTSTNQLLRLSVTGGVGCAFQLQASPDLRTWTDSIQLQPDKDPYEFDVAPSGATAQFYRLRKLE